MMRPLRLLLLFVLVLGGCRSAAPPAREPEVRVLLVRHAETAPDGTRDPALSEAGRERAARLADRVAEQPSGLVAVYATEYRRTQETAAPAAARAGVEVTVVPYGAGPLEAFVERLAAQVRGHLGAPHPPGATVLVVGHSNTTPALAEALAGGLVAPISEDEYGRVIHVRLRPEGGVLVEGE